MQLIPISCKQSLGSILLWCCICTGGLHAAETDALDFDDTMLQQPLSYPDWFKLSVGDLRDDVEEAVQAGKQGIAIYFGQKRCAYCEQFFKQDLGQPDIARYMQQHYDVIPIDIWGIEEFIDSDGKTYTERELALKYKANFTPTVVFYDSDGKAVFRVRGFYPPYKFRAALEYVSEGFYKKEKFRDYLARAEPGMFFFEGGLTDREFFLQPPYDLSALLENKKPLAVFFEQGNCHACDLLHSGPLNQDNSLAEITKMQVIQLDMWSDTPVTTPAGEKTTARQWADRLGLFHSPSILFFDADGNEIMRIDSVVQYYRLWGVLDYVNKRGYLDTDDYQSWRLQQRKIK
jgi:thioredoxin-related protein